MFNCKEDPKEFSNYIYTDKGEVLKCENMEMKLYNEALFAFENDLKEYYGTRNNNNGNELRSYSAFVREAVGNRVDYGEMVSPHTLEVFEALKNRKEIWNERDAKSNLNYNSALFKCIAENIQSEDLRKTLAALLSTNSMSTKLFGAPLQTSYSQVTKDKYLAAYMAFDLFYAKLFDADLSGVGKEQTDDSAEPTQEAEPSDPHAGHNH